MFKSYISSTIHYLRKNFSYSLISISGLSIALSCATILGLYLKFELSYDQYHQNHDRLFRLIAAAQGGGYSDNRAMTPQPLGALFSRDYSEVADFVRLRDLPEKYRVTVEETDFFWDSLMYADPNVFNAFTFNVLAGDPNTALQEPLSIAVSESFARAYFADENPADILGRSVDTNDGQFEISLIFKDQPGNTHLKYDALFPYSLVPEDVHEDAFFGVKEGVSDFTYLLLQENYKAEDFAEISNDFNKRYIENSLRGGDFKVNYYLEPIDDIHLNSNTTGDRPRGDKDFLLTLFALGALVVLLSVINYMNLATALALNRAKEIGIRKVLGAEKVQLFSQFLAESIIYCLFAIPFSLLCTELVLMLAPLSMLNQAIGPASLMNPETIVSVALGALCLGFITGIYPSFYLSAQKLIGGGRNRRSQTMVTGELLIRQGLVLIQFAISIGVITSAIIMFSQLQYMQNKSLGFDRENFLVVNVAEEAHPRVDLLKDLIMQNPGVLAVSTGRRVPGGEIPSSIGTINGERFLVKTLAVGPNYLGVMGMTLLAGSDIDFNLPMTPDSAKIVVNEAFLKSAGWSLDEAVGNFYGTAQIVGVVADYHIEDLKTQIAPTMISPDLYNRPNYMFIRVSGENIQGTLAAIEKIWKENVYGQDFTYSFLDDMWGQLYVSEEKQLFFVELFSVICIFLAELGLTGLAAFSLKQRNKEIGIRIVMGASFWQVVMLLFRNIFYLVLIAAPVGTLLFFDPIMEWMQNFYYQKALDAGWFVYPTMFCLTMALGIVFLQTWRLSKSKPINALRTE